MSHAKRILSRVRIHGGDSGVSARATHHNVRGFISEQAELRTVRRSTTERKQMSTKTTFKRVALGTVAALATSLLTVVAAPSASALIAAGDYNVSGLGTAANGNCVAYNATDDVAVVNRNLITQATLDYTYSAGAIAAGTTNVVKIAVTGPALITTQDSAAGATANYSATGVLASDGKSYTWTGVASIVTHPDDVVVKFTGAGTVVAKVTYTTSSSVTLTDTITIYALDTCDNDSYDATKSSAKVQARSTAATAQDTAGDEAAGTTRTFADTSYIALWLADKYGTAIASTSRYLSVSATNGAFVKFDGTPTATTDVTTTTINDAVVYVTNGGVYKPVNTTVTIKLNDTVIATKTINFTGVAAKIVLDSYPKYLSGTKTGVKYTVLDAAGNRITETASVGDSANNVNSASTSTYVATDSVTSGTYSLVASSTEGASATTIKVMADDGTWITSDPIKFTTSTKTVDTYSVTTDKKTYAPGEIVTVTITAKNAKGNLVADETALADSSANLVVVAAGLTKVAADPVYTDSSTSGTWVYKYYASTTPAAYGFSIKKNAATTDTAQVANFTVVTAGSSEIAQLVKVIGSLLTTFTKQISALIKALKR